jgi:galactokinase
MKPGMLAAQLVAAGLDDGERARKANLFGAVLSAFDLFAGNAPDAAQWVPGRLEVFGTHTDYAGGRALVAALPRGFALAARRRAGGHIRVLDATSGESLTIEPAGPQSRSSNWRRYVEVVAARLGRNFPGAALGADVVFASDLPRASGMSSSSALMVGVASTLVRLSDVRGHSEWQANITTPVDEAGYYACIENGRTFRGLSGDAGVGTHGGSEDQAAMVCGAPGMLSAYAFVPMRPLESVRLPAEWAIAVATSGVAAEKTGAALNSYNRLSEGASVLLDLWNRSSEAPAGCLATALVSAPEAIDRLRSVVKSTPVAGWTAGALENRLQHFVREDARVPAALLAFRDLDAGTLEALGKSSQQDAEDLIGNQIAETIDLARTGLACGAFATRSFGAGFGGSVWALVASEDADAFTRRWLTAYGERYRHERATAFVAHPGPGLVELG